MEVDCRFSSLLWQGSSSEYFRLLSLECSVTNESENKDKQLRGVGESVVTKI